MAATLPYMNQLINYFVSQGYVSGTTIRAAPYDWRLSAGESQCIHNYLYSKEVCMLLMILYY